MQYIIAKKIHLSTYRRLLEHVEEILNFNSMCVCVCVCTYICISVLPEDEYQKYLEPTGWYMCGWMKFVVQFVCNELICTYRIVRNLIKTK